MEKIKIMSKTKVYVAIPYSGIEEESFSVANQVTSDLMNEGNYIPFSPISHSHPIAIQCSVPGDWAFWEEFDTSFLEWCDEVHVVVIDKERVLNSTGVQAEIGIAEKLGKPIKYYYPNDKTYSDSLI